MRPNGFVAEQVFEVFDCAGEAVRHRDPRAPSEYIVSPGNVRTTLSWIVLWSSSMYDARARSGEVDHEVRKFQNGELFRISEIDRTRYVVGGVHETNEAVDQIIYVTE